jgi:hypothetical protein
MAGNTIGLEVIGRLREKYMDLWFATGATDSDLASAIQCCRSTTPASTNGMNPSWTAVA